jgi:thiosulfate/3-mercaptopyruvate sulfurtransferase
VVRSAEPSHRGSTSKPDCQGSAEPDWFTDLHDPLRRDDVDQEGFSRVLQQVGVGPDTTVVLYGGNNNWFAAYANWLSRYLAFDAVKLLDGGARSGSSTAAR